MISSQFRCFFIIFSVLWTSLACLGERLPIPRYASLKTDLVNVRVGPGENFPIIFVYKKQNFPIQIIAEFQEWRRIKDFEGDMGWVHRRVLRGKKFCRILEEGYLYKKPNLKSGKCAKVQVGVIAEIKTCKDDFCQLIFPNLKGWVETEKIWGRI